jgi:hypothetical protein
MIQTTTSKPGNARNRKPGKTGDLGKHVNWERDPNGQLVVRDASSGQVLKVVRSLFQLFRRG